MTELGPSPLLTPDHLKLISIDELWALHAEIAAVLARRLSAEKRQLEQRLQALRAMGVSNDNPRERRPYPQVFPKYRNLANPSETWAGREEAAALADCTASIRKKNSTIS